MNTIPINQIFHFAYNHFIGLAVVTWTRRSILWFASLVFQFKDSRFVSVVWLVVSGCTWEHPKPSSRWGVATNMTQRKFNTKQTLNTLQHLYQKIMETPEWASLHMLKQVIQKVALSMMFLQSCWNLCMLGLALFTRIWNAYKCCNLICLGLDWQTASCQMVKHPRKIILISWGQWTSYTDSQNWVSDSLQQFSHNAKNIRTRTYKLSLV